MNCFTTDKELALLQALAAGDEQAFKQLFDAYRNKLFYYISRLIKSDQVAEELVTFKQHVVRQYHRRPTVLLEDGEDVLEEIELLVARARPDCTAR